MSIKDRAVLAHDVFRQERHPLEPFFTPKDVAVIGATEAQGSVGRTILWNLVRNRSAALSTRSTRSGPASSASGPTQP